MYSILVIQQKMIGDVLLSSILCEGLKKKYPEAIIDYLVYPNTIPVIKNNPFIDTIIPFEKEYKDSKQSFFKFLKKIRNKNYTMVIDAYGKTESNLITLFSGANEKISYYKWYTSIFYTSTIKRKPITLTNAGNALENRLRLIHKEEDIVANIIRPMIFLTNEERISAKKYLQYNELDAKTPLIMISVLGSSKEKSLPPLYMAKIIDFIALITQGNIIFNYIPNQIREAKEIYDLTHKTTQKHIHFNVFGKNLREFIGILSHCTMLIGNEGGAVNMAKALDINTFTIFSPWIRKDVWNMFEDGKHHDSTHLIDYNPEIYKEVTYKKLKNKSIELYKELTPERIIPKLNNYITNLMK